jgi:hypothetical protein
VSPLRTFRGSSGWRISILVPEARIELATPSLEGKCSVQLSYSGKVVVPAWIEQATFEVGARRSLQLSYRTVASLVSP